MRLDHYRHNFHLWTGIKIFKLKELHPTTTAAVVRSHRLEITTRGSGVVFSVLLLLCTSGVWVQWRHRGRASPFWQGQSELRGQRAGSGGGQWGGYLWFCKEIVMLTTIHAVTTYNVPKKFGNTLGLKMGQYQRKNPQHFWCKCISVSKTIKFFFLIAHFFSFTDWLKEQQINQNTVWRCFINCSCTVFFYALNSLIFLNTFP